MTNNDAKKAAYSALLGGLALVLYAGYSLLGGPGVALALGVLLMMLGWWVGSTIVKGEAMLPTPDDPDLAIADHTKAIEADPRNASAYESRGAAYESKGDHDRAIADYTKAIEIEPKNADYYNSRAWAYFEAGQAARALSDAERSLQLRPDDANTLDTRGHILDALGRREDAIADFRRALALDPNIQESRVALKRLGAAP
jgi:tetratricopeptide (TPR) repeat protein